MTLNDLEWPFCVKICFGLSNLCVGVSGFRTILFENLHSYPYTVSDKNVAQGTYSCSFWQYKVYADIRGRSLERGRWKWRFSLHSFTVFRTFYTHGQSTRQLSHDTTVNDLGRISRSLDCFTSNFSKNGVWYGKSYYRLLIGSHTLAFDWCHFWWPWSTFGRHFSLGCHFHVHFSNPWHAFASHGLPAIAELLVCDADVRQYCVR